MKFRYTYTLSLLALLIICCLGCEDGNERIKLYYAPHSGDAEVELVDEALLEVGFYNLNVEGGNGVYYAKSDNDDVVSILVEDDRLRLSALQTGKTTIHVVDGNNVSRKLELSIKEKVDVIEVEDSYVDLQVPQTSQKYRSAIDYMKRIIDSGLKKKGMSYKLTYTSVDEGKLTIYPQAHSEEYKIEGSFTRTTNKKGESVLTLNVSGYLRSYTLRSRGGDYDMSLNGEMFGNGSTKAYLVEDYSRDYPFTELPALKAEGVEAVTISRK